MVGQFLGNYRAKVVDNKDPEKYGRVLVWIPYIMPLVSDSEGLWARPANNPVGGRNLEDDPEQNYMGTCYIPRKGSWTWIFFEMGDINRPYYFGALDIEHSKVLPENQVGTNYEDKWTIFKSHDGRTIIVSDDPDDERVEITGKKRNLSSPPSGDTASVYEIDGNQTTILFDERDGKEKLLIRTRKGDFFHIDVDEQKLQAYFKSDVIIKTDGSFYMTAKEDVHLKAKTGDFNVEAESEDVNINAASNINESCGETHNAKAGKRHNAQATISCNVTAGVKANFGAPTMNIQEGQAGGAGGSGTADDADPEGERNT